MPGGGVSPNCRCCDDFLIALLDLPGDFWPDLAIALPDKLYDRINQYLERRLS